MKHKGGSTDPSDFFRNDDLRYTYHDNFDLLTIRHEFLKNTGHVDQNYIKKFLKIADITAKLMSEKYRFNYQKVGFDLSDITSISRIYLVGYLSKYGFKHNENNKQKFVDKFTKTRKRLPTDAELTRAERNEIITFLRQKLHHCSSVCERKSRNISVACNKRGYFAKTESAISDVDPVELLDNYEKYGYRKVTHNEFKTAKRKAREDRSKVVHDKKGQEIVLAEFLDPGIHVTEYLSLIESYDTIYTSNPETYLIKLEEERQDDCNRELFDSLSVDKKNILLRKFIDKNAGDKDLREELINARRILKRNNFWYGH